MKQQPIETVLKKWLKIKPYGCNIKIAGRHFAGRFAETLFEPTSFLWGSNILRINFDQYEILTILKPEGVKILNKTNLVITDAAEIRIGWYYYGRDIKSANWCENIYIINGKKIQLIEIFNSQISEKIFTYDGEYMIDIDTIITSM